MPKRKQSRDKDGIYQRGDSPYWWASFVDAGGKRTRCSTGTADRREAEALLAKWRLAAHMERQWDEQPERTFDELMLGYLKETQGQKRDPVRDRCSLRHLFPVFSGRTLSAITPADVRGYIRERRSEGAAASTINKEVGLFSSACNYARREWDWFVPNPAAQCKQSEPEGRVRWLSRPEAASLLRAARQEPRARHLADFIRLALHTGCRKGELLGLEWRRVNLQEGLIFLESAHTKTARRRSVPLNSESRAALLARMRFRAEHCPDSPWVFCRKTGARIADVKKAFASACGRAGIEDFRVHDLRHTCAAWLVTAGVPLPEVRDLLGHKTIEMTERYAHLAPDNIRAAVGRLEEVKSRSGHAE